ncbi:spore coat protein YsxE [Ectobacillus funiculus]
METAVREQYEPLLQMYRLNPEHLEEHGSVLKVYTNQGPYALKRLSPSRLERSNFVHHLRFLSEKGFTNYAPVYHASDGEYFLSDGQHQYYLMPWLDSAEQKGEENDHYHQMFQTLAAMHQKTVKEESITEETIDSHYNALSGRWEQDRDMLDTFLTQSEAKWYMSPLELQYCTYYHHVLRAHEFAAKQLEEWQELMKEKETTRISLIHGNVSQKSFFCLIMSETVIFISLEKFTVFPHRYRILYSFYQRSFNTYPIARNDRYEWYQMYQKHFPYTKEEKS